MTVEQGMQSFGVIAIVFLLAFASGMLFEQFYPSESVEQDDTIWIEVKDTFHADKEMICTIYYADGSDPYYGNCDLSSLKPQSDKKVEK